MQTESRVLEHDRRSRHDSWQSGKKPEEGCDGKQERGEEEGGWGCDHGHTGIFFLSVSSVSVRLWVSQNV